MPRPPKEDLVAFKRRVRRAASLDGEPLVLAEGLHLVRGLSIVDAEAVLATIKQKGALDLASFGKTVTADGAPVRVDETFLASVQHELRVLASREALAFARENRRVLARYGAVDGTWIRDKREKLERLRGARIAPPDPARWFDAALDVVRVARGDAGHRALVRAAQRIRARAARSRKSTRDMREDALSGVALLALAFRGGDEDLPLVSASAIEALKGKGAWPLSFGRHGITAKDAVALSELDLPQVLRKRFAEWIGQGLESELLFRACAEGHAKELGEVPDVRAARAYATWATKLVPHYRALGVDFALSPALFAHLPRNEDLAVLAMCLMEPIEAPEIDPLRVLDATLGLFRRLPAKAKDLLARLQGSASGVGRRRFPEFAAWLDDDALLDRYLHVLALAGEAIALSKRIRQDFEHHEKTRREIAHLEKIRSRTKPQQDRLDLLLRTDRREAPRARTRRRLKERIDAVLRVAYRRELDAVFREILREAWGISAPSLTPAWRDAVRFWLVVDDNRELLGRLLREAGRAPGRGVWLAFEESRAWAERVAPSIDVDAWLAPRERRAGDYTLSLEQDPLEVLRMGIPFGTCLALEDGVNAASTVVNAIEANKRVLYVRNASGKIVARKLLAISRSLRIIGYKLYSAVSGKEEEKIRAAVLDFVKRLAADVRAPLASSGTPELLHQGAFWYDDGTVPFADDPDLVAYCRSLGLAPPVISWEEGIDEAAGWEAARAGDVDGAIDALRFWRWGPASDLLGRFVLDRLGERRAFARAREHRGLLFALGRILCDCGEDGVVRLLELVTRAQPGVGRLPLLPLVLRFPRSRRIARALASMAERSLARVSDATDHGLYLLTTRALPRMVSGVSETIEVLDRIDRIWESVASVHRHLVTHRDGAIDRAAWALVVEHERRPDPDAVAECLVDRRRSLAAHTAALRVATVRVLRDGTRLLDRFARIRPGLPDEVLARARQSGAAEPVPWDVSAEHAFAVLRAGHPMWSFVAGRYVENQDAARAILDKKILFGHELDPADVAVLFQDEALRRPLARAFVRVTDDEWSARVWAAERAGAATGTSCEGLLEDVARELVVGDDGPGKAAVVETLDQLRSVVNVFAREAPPAAAASFYENLPDLLAVATFVRATKRLPRDRMAALRQAASRNEPEWESEDWVARRAWLAGEDRRRPACRPEGHPLSNETCPTSSASKGRRPTSRTTRSKRQ